MSRAKQIASTLPALLLGGLVTVHAQQPPAPAAAAPPAKSELPRPDELEPAVDTTHAPAPAAPAGAAAVAPATNAAAPSSAAAPGTAPPPRAAGAEKPVKGAGRKGPDTLQLDTTEITGNRELPKVLYIVPWKRSDLGDLAGRPVNSLLDEVLQPLDRDVFRRENRYYDALQPGRAAPKAEPVQGSGDKP